MAPEKGPRRMSESGRRRPVADRRADFVVEQLDEEIQLVRRRIEELSGSGNGSVDFTSCRRRDVSPQSATSQMDFRCDISDKSDVSSQAAASQMDHRYNISDRLASSRRLPEISDLDIITPSQHILNLSSHGYDDEPVTNQREPMLNRPTHQSNGTSDLTKLSAE